MGGGALGSAMDAVGTAAKAAGTDMYNGAKNSLFGVEHPMPTAQNTVQGQPTGANATNNYQNTSIGRLFGAGQPAQQTAAQRNRMMQAQQG
jgi:hypothetical protein